MKTAVKEKFIQNEYLLQEILSTDNLEFVEASPYDTVWGVGLTEDDPLILNKKNWKGQNLLGIILTEVRNELKSIK